MDSIAKLGLPSGLVDLTAAQAKVSTLKRAAAEAGSAAKADKLRTMAEEFEQIFLQNMLSTMMEGTTPEAPFNGGAGEEQWKGFLVNEYAGAIAQNGGVGLADTIYRDLIAIQEGQK